MCSFQAEGNEISFPQAIQWKRGSYGASGGGMCLSTEERLFLAYLITKLKNTNLNFTVLMAYRTLRITWFHEFRQKLFTLETWIWLLRPKEMLYCKHLFLLHSCPCESTQSVVVRKILFPVTVACQECQGLLPCLFWAEVHTNTHTPNPACFQGLLKLYQLMKHIRCQILRFLFFFYCILPVLRGNMKEEKQSPVRKIWSFYVKAPSPCRAGVSHAGSLSQAQSSKWENLWSN